MPFGKAGRSIKRLVKKRMNPKKSRGISELKGRRQLQNEPLKKVMYRSVKGLETGTPSNPKTVAAVTRHLKGRKMLKIGTGVGVGGAAAYQIRKDYKAIKGKKKPGSKSFTKK